MPRARSRRKVSVWAASSLVGERMRTLVPRRGCLRRWWRMGRRNAAVFPDPVLAVPTTSLPARMAGMASAWMGVGEE
jgi:hypothetical protein